jgi:hypothetical protein
MSSDQKIEQHWREEAEAARQEAEKLPHGPRRDALLKKERQLRTACRIIEWVSSPELQPPT